LFSAAARCGSESGRRYGKKLKLETQKEYENTFFPFLVATDPTEVDPEPGAVSVRKT